MVYRKIIMLKPGVTELTILSIKTSLDHHFGDDNLSLATVLTIGILGPKYILTNGLDNENMKNSETPLEKATMTCKKQNILLIPNQDTTPPQKKRKTRSLSNNYSASFV